MYRDYQPRLLQKRDPSATDAAPKLRGIARAIGKSALAAKRSAARQGSVAGRQARAPPP